jgi:hypothetical protein
VATAWDLGATPAIAGPWVTLDAKSGRFVADFADAGNELPRHEYRRNSLNPGGTKKLAGIPHCSERTVRNKLSGGGDTVEGTCNARASDDRNWFEIQVLERRLQAAQPEGARFALHVFSPVLFATSRRGDGDGAVDDLRDS